MDIKKILKAQNDYFETNETKNTKFRKQKLIKLLNTVTKYEDDIMNSLRADINKSNFESYISEIAFFKQEIKYTINNIHKWSKSRRVKTPLFHLFSTSYIYNEPYGSVLIISPWNYPFQLLFVPLIGAIAAGNCVVLKTSTHTTNTNKYAKIIIEEVFNKEHVTIISGDDNIGKELTQQKFDYIFFTGSSKVGKIIMKEAANNLIPTTLELGGKSPCIVDFTADIDITARRIIWGKFLNAGQTCVAPDYILVDKTVKAQFIKALIIEIKNMYSNDPINNSEYPRIINKHHMNRLCSLLNDQIILYGGDINKNNLKISPTLIEVSDIDNIIMNDEIFGPILPIIEVDNLQQAINIVKSFPKPLASYLFTTSKENEKIYLKSCSFGGGCINDTIIHLSTPFLPFGGVGESGYGKYRGKYSFDLFTNKKSVLKKSNILDIRFRYPPFKNKLSILKKYMK